MTRAAGPNVDQIEYWNTVAGASWTKHQEKMDLQLRPIGRRALEVLRIAPGERALDVGCGCGDSTLEIARVVGPGGSAIGVDLSAPMLARAEERAREAGLSNATFLEADAQTEPFGSAGFDLLHSRFGVMFFSDPEAAFRNLLAALRPGGRLGFVCWQALVENPWMGVPLAAVAQHVELPPPPPPAAPGPFAFADRDRVHRILQSAGFDRVRLDPRKEHLAPGGGGLRDAVEILIEIGPVARVLREADAGPELRRRVAGAIQDALAPFKSHDGVRLPAATWIVTARRPG